jgi:hypothetical protein
MVYMQNSVAWGEVITKKAIRVSTWLRTPMAPQYIPLHHGQVLTIGNSAGTRPQAFATIYVPVPLIDGFHIMPPDYDSLDYDAHEPNRMMQPVDVLVGAFRFKGRIRISSHTDLEHYLDTSKEIFSSLYDVEISQLSQPGQGVVRVSMAIVRRDKVVFAI